MLLWYSAKAKTTTVNFNNNSCKSCDFPLYVGVSKRIWRTEIIQDHLEEAEEMFEVLLVSPEGTVIGRINKAQVTIRDSGRGKNNVPCTFL